MELYYLTLFVCTLVNDFLESFIDIPTLEPQWNTMKILESQDYGRSNPMAMGRMLDSDTWEQMANATPQC